MAPKKGAPVKAESSRRKNKSKGETQPASPKGRRVAVMGPTGKVRFEWRTQ